MKLHARMAINGGGSSNFSGLVKGFKGAVQAAKGWFNSHGVENSGKGGPKATANKAGKAVNEQGILQNANGEGVETWGPKLEEGVQKLAAGKRLAGEFIQDLENHEDFDPPGYQVRALGLTKGFLQGVVQMRKTNPQYAQPLKNEDPAVKQARLLWGNVGHGPFADGDTSAGLGVVLAGLSIFGLGNDVNCKNLCEGLLESQGATEEGYWWEPEVKQLAAKLDALTPASKDRVLAQSAQSGLKIINMRLQEAMQKAGLGKEDSRDLAKQYNADSETLNAVQNGAPDTHASLVMAILGDALYPIEEDSGDNESSSSVES